MASITSVLAGLPSMGFGIGLSPQVGIALALTLVGSLSTALGGALVVLQAVPDIKRLGLLQGFASGLMLSLTFFDLVPEAIDAIGFPAANLWFFAGALLFATVVHFVPEPSLAPEPSVAPEPSSEPLLQYSSDPALHFLPRFLCPPVSLLTLPPLLPSGPASGISLAVATALHNIPEGRAVALPICLNTFPLCFPSPRSSSSQGLRVGISLAVAIALHNIPEGLAVALPIYLTRSPFASHLPSSSSSSQGLRVGISLAVAIALHNIPEGLAVALPIYFGTRSRWAAFRAAALSGAAEPLGVIFVALFFPASLAPDIIEGLLAGVGGIMAFLVLHEMLPLAFEYAGHRRAVQAMFLGMAVMSANLHLLALSLPPDISL
ncbi:unnamed protein product [Closterium sp. Naga37s-1]|nr:unnamed protein product [Closterium sp. Naga37s-1]